MLMETAEVLKKISYICKYSRKCKECPLLDVHCTMVPQQWKKKDIAEMAKAIDNYKEGKNV